MGPSIGDSIPVINFEFRSHRVINNQRSVKQKNSVAAGRLYSLYLHNSVVPEDKIKAYMWFKVAKVLGQNLSIAKEERLKSNMTLEEAAESQRLATEWWMTHQ